MFKKITPRKPLSGEAAKKKRISYRLSKKKNGWLRFSVWATEEASQILKTVANVLKAGGDLNAARLQADELIRKFPSQKIESRKPEGAISLHRSVFKMGFEAVGNRKKERQARYSREYFDKRAEVGEYRHVIFIRQEWRELLTQINQEMREKSGVAAVFITPRAEERAQHEKNRLEMQKMRQDGKSRAEIAAKLNVSMRTVSRNWK